MVQDEDEAHDTAQDVFIQVFESVKNFRGDSSLSTWIYRIAVRKALDKIRKRERKLGLFQWLTGGKENQDINFNHPGILLENKERAAILFKAVRELPEKQRIAFTLIKVQKMSYQEAQDILQQNIKGIESLVNRAKVNLQKKLEHYYQQR